MKLSLLAIAVVAILGVGVCLSHAGPETIPLLASMAHETVVAMGIVLPASRGIIAVRADVSDPKAALAELQKAWTEFQGKNEERLKAIEDGKADVVLNEQVDRINASITKLQGELAEVATKAAARSLGAGGDDDVAITAAQFARERGQDISVEAYKAYTANLDTYFRRGDATPAAVRAEMSVGSDPDGGYTVTPDTSGRIIKRVYETSPMRQVASQVTIGTDALEGFNDLDEAAAGWVGEKQARLDTDTPQLGKWTIPVHEVYAQPKATQKLLDELDVQHRVLAGGKSVGQVRAHGKHRLPHR